MVRFTTILISSLFHDKNNKPKCLLQQALRFIVFLLIHRYPISAITQPEELFIKQHAPPAALQQNLDLFFTARGLRFTTLLDGQNILNTKEELNNILSQEEFSIHSLRYKQKENTIAVFKMILTHHQLPDFFIKIGCWLAHPHATIMRMIILDRIAAIIDNKVNDIHTIEKVEKWLYHRQNRPAELTDFNYVVIAKKVTGVPLDTRKKIPLDVQKVFDLLKLNNNQEPVISLFKENILVTPQGNYAFIDTEFEAASVKNNDYFNLELETKH
jgi:hypothetical protein